jgi:hypothetical protein
MSGAVDEPVVTGSAHTVPGEPVRRHDMIEALYHANSVLAEGLERMTSVIAGLDDDQFSADLWSIQQAVLRFDRDLRAAR